jgi:hypothetical protein
MYTLQTIDATGKRSHSPESEEMAKGYRAESLGASRVPDFGQHQANPQHYLHYVAQGQNEQQARIMAKQQTQKKQGLLPRATAAAAPQPVTPQTFARSPAEQNEQHLPPVNDRLPDGDASHRLNSQHPAYYMARGVSYEQARAMAQAKTQSNQGLLPTQPVNQQRCAHPSAEQNEHHVPPVDHRLPDGDILHHQNPQHPAYYVARGHSEHEARLLAKQRTQINQGLLPRATVAAARQPAAQQRCPHPSTEENEQHVAHVEGRMASEQHVPSVEDRILRRCFRPPRPCILHGSRRRPRSSTRYGENPSTHEASAARSTAR